MPRDWNSAYENNDTPWDKGYAAPPLVEFLQSRSILGKVLVPGCGSGHDVRLLAGQGADVTGLDLSSAALRKASIFPKSGNECYALGDFLALEEQHHATYDWIFEHTCLCAIEPPQRSAYVRSLKLALRPGAYYLAIFFREVADYDGEGPPHPISADQIETLFSYDFELLEAFVPRQSYPSRPLGSEEVRWMRLQTGIL